MTCLCFFIHSISPFKGQVSFLSLRTFKDIHISRTFGCAHFCLDNFHSLLFMPIFTLFYETSHFGSLYMTIFADSNVFRDLIYFLLLFDDFKPLFTLDLLNKPRRCVFSRFHFYSLPLQFLNPPTTGVCFESIFALPNSVHKKNVSILGHK